MDFQKIRKKAKEHGARASGPEAASPQAPAAMPATPGPVEPAVPREADPRGPPEGHRAPPPPAAEPDAAELGSRLQELPEAAEGDAEADAEAEADPRFTTWRPGTGQRPIPPVPDARPAQAPPPPPAAPVARAARPPEGPAPGVTSAPPPREPASPAHVEARGATSAEVPRRHQRDPLDDFFFRADEEVLALAGLPADQEVRPGPRPEDAGLEEYLTFRLGPEEYAVAIERVREVLKSQPITEVPRAPAGILGVVTVRGEVVAVFDPRRRLGLPGQPPPESTGRIVIVDDGQGRCGLLVDGVAGVVRLARGTIEPCPQGIGGASADCLAGIGRERDRLFTVLDLEALLRRAPARGERTGHAGT